MAKKKATFPDLVYVHREYDGNDKSSTWLTASESISGAVDDHNWREFAIYKRVGTGRGRVNPNPEIVGDKQVRALIAQAG